MRDEEKTEAETEKSELELEAEQSQQTSEAAADFRALIEEKKYGPRAAVTGLALAATWQTKDAGLGLKPLQDVVRQIWNSWHAWESAKATRTAPKPSLIVTPDDIRREMANRG